MQNTIQTDPSRYAATIEASRRVRFDIDRDVIRGRNLDFAQTFLPEGLTLSRDVALDDGEKRLLSQIQGRTYANMFRMVERAIAGKMLQVTRGHWFGDQTALEAIVRFTDEELKHQELFRRVEELMAAGMPSGYVFVPDLNAVAATVVAKSDWGVLAFVCCVELFTLRHWREAIADASISPLWKDVFLHHAREEAQHAVLDEVEWQRADECLDAAARDAAVTDLIDLVTSVDGIVQQQAEADAGWFLRLTPRRRSASDESTIRDLFLRGYRWQYIGSGVHGRFPELLAAKITPAQLARVQRALAPIVG